jgi:hypothetical protein
MKAYLIASWLSTNARARAVIPCNCIPDRPITYGANSVVPRYSATLTIAPMSEVAIMRKLNINDPEEIQLIGKVNGC